MFRPLHTEADRASRGAFRPDGRFTGQAIIAPQPRPGDGLSEAWDEGFRTGMAQARAECARDAATATRIEDTLARLADSETETLAERLRETVIALCGAVLERGAIDPDALSRRVAAAHALLRRSTDERVLRLHPEDLALMAERLPAGLEARADPALERGALRLETAAGGVEDGPAQWREAIAAAVRAC